MSDRALRTTMIVLATIGLGVASYLTYIHYSGTPPLCSTTHNTCLKVQTSIYSKLAGVPVALIGLIGYVGILGSLLAPQREETRFATMALTLVGFGFSAYLTSREAFSLHEYCEWCLSSAVIMTVLAGLATWRFLRGAPPASVAPVVAAEPDGGAQLAAGS
ncbi:MAG TPA: vitamin K epoxide reductase family protein [Solirubrobacteraceae bacterium]|jgi:uncharacterized membrane protein|nr:vitamin K epoxide reductase family protein [Solirubrobacteraceae bacterium]